MHVKKRIKTLLEQREELPRLLLALLLSLYLLTGSNRTGAAASDRKLRQPGSAGHDSSLQPQVGLRREPERCPRLPAPSAASVFPIFNLWL